MKIFFDVDGVLIDGWHADINLRRPWDSTIEADLGIDQAAFRDEFFGKPGNRSSSPMAACVVGRRDLKEALGEVLPQVGYNGNVDDFVRYWFEKDSIKNVDVFNLLDDLRSHGPTELFLATGQEHYRARYLWDELGFSRHFDDIFYSARIGYLKKDMRFFEAINAALGINGEEKPLFFDDQVEIVDMANRVGWDATAVRSPNDIRQHPRLRHIWL